MWGPGRGFSGGTVGTATAGITALHLGCRPGLRGRGGAVADVQLLVDALQVLVDGPLGDLELVGDGGGRGAGRDPAQNASVGGG